MLLFLAKSELIRTVWWPCVSLDKSLEVYKIYLRIYISIIYTRVFISVLKQLFDTSSRNVACITRAMRANGGQDLIVPHHFLMGEGEEGLQGKAPATCQIQRSKRENHFMCGWNQQNSKNLIAQNKCTMLAQIRTFPKSWLGLLVWITKKASWKETKYTVNIWIMIRSVLHKLVAQWCLLCEACSTMMSCVCCFIHFFCLSTSFVRQVAVTQILCRIANL